MKRRRRETVAEHEATGDTERVFHEIRQTFRVTGINLNFGTWAAYPEIFPLAWDALRPNVETPAFEDAADEIRRQAVLAAAGLPGVDALARAELGESQRFRLRGALDLFHYVDPKLLVFTAALRRALEGELPGPTLIGPEGPPRVRLERGAPEDMHAMEMVDEAPEDPRVRAVFEDMKQTLGLEAVSSEYRALALFPSYLEAAWRHLKPLAGDGPYQRAAGQLREVARSVASSLPHAVDLSPGRLRPPASAVHGEFLAEVERFERLLPSLVLNVSLLVLEGQPAERAMASPFPPTFRPVLVGGAP